MWEIHEILEKYWGYSSFRPGQEEAIRSVLAGNDTLLLLPTGGGKSICFQVPALASGKLCIVVSPLIALMKDQVDQLKRRGIQAAAIFSGMSEREIDITLDNCVYGQISFLYVSPERLMTELMIERTKKMKVGLLAVDEAHCISQWGYDFRSSYLKIAEFRKLLPGVPVMAVTASATNEVRADILDKLCMRNAKIFTRTFARDNLSYSVINTESKETKLLQILTKVKGSTIVYTRTRNRTVQIANWLVSKGITASAYHAGLSTQERDQRQQSWINDRTRVMVATNAFGMGIDKPDVRAVIHWDLPASLEAYYQEAGRAGRDGLKAYAVAMYNEQDLNLLRKGIQQKYPDIEFLKRVYQSIANFFQIPIGSGYMASYDFDAELFATNYNYGRLELFYALKFLEQEGFLLLNEDFDSPSRVKFLINKIDLYDFQLRYFNYDPFIKRLLRFHGGEMFSEYVSISEAALAKSLKCPINEVFKGLEFLATRNIIDYQRQKNLPQIQLLTPRYDANKLPLALESIKKRREKDTAKIEAVVHYASHPALCRSMMLLQYFDEKEAPYCNLCDHCIQRKKAIQSKRDLSSLAAQIRDYVAQQGKLQPNELKLAFPDLEIATFSSALHWLVEQEVLIYDRSGFLLLNQNSS